METQPPRTTTPQRSRLQIPLWFGFGVMGVYAVLYGLLRSHFVLESVVVLCLAVFCFAAGRPIGRRQWLMIAGCIASAVAVLLIVRAFAVTWFPH